MSWLGWQCRGPYWQNNYTGVVGYFMLTLKEKQQQNRTVACLSF